MARVFFMSGQAKIEGPGVPIQWPAGGIDLSVTLPAAIKETTFQLFERQYAELPIAPAAAAYLFSYAEFVLPICLLLGFATRFAAVGLLALTMLLQIYVAPAMWWSLHVYWLSILLVLVLLRPRRHLHRRLDPHHLPARSPPCRRLSAFPSACPSHGAAVPSLRSAERTS